MFSRGSRGRLAFGVDLGEQNVSRLAARAGWDSGCCSRGNLFVVGIQQGISREGLGSFW